MILVQNLSLKYTERVKEVSRCDVAWHFVLFSFLYVEWITFVIDR